MPGARDIRAGGAYVEISARDGAFLRGLSRAQGQLRAFASSCASIGSSLLSVSGAALAPLGLATAAFAGFDDSMRSVAAVTGATGEQFDALAERARALGAATRYTAQEAAGAMLALGRAGMGAEQIDASIQSVLALATATGTDLAQSADIVSNTLNMFGLAAERSGHAADVLTATANGSAQTLTDLFEALKMIGPQAKAAGYSLEETSAAVGVLANVGLKGSMAGNALKRALQQFADPATQKRLAEIGVAVKTADGELRALPEIFRDLAVAMNGLPGADKLALAKDIFDVRASGAGLNLAANVDALDAFLAKLREVDGAAAKTEESMNAGIGGALASLKSAAQDVALSVGDALAPALQALADQWRGNLNAISEWVARHGEAIVAVTKGVAAVTAFGAALFVVNKAIAVVNTATTILKVSTVVLHTVMHGFGLLMVKMSGFTRGLAFSLGSLSSISATLTGIMTKLTAAIGATGAAMVATIAVAAAVAAAILGVVAVVAKLTTHNANLSDAMHRAREEGEAMRDQDKERFRRFKELADKERLEADEMSEAILISRDLRGRYGDIGLTVDTLSGSLGVAADAQERLNAAMRKADVKQLNAELAEAERNLREIEKAEASRDTNWWAAEWDFISSGFDLDRTEKIAKELADRKTEALERIREIRRRLRADEAANQISATAATVERGAGERLADTDAVTKAVEDLAHADEELRRGGLSALARQIEDVEAARDKYVAAAQAVIDFENAQADAWRDEERIAEMEERIAARRIAAEREIAALREKAAKAGEDALRRLDEEVAGVAGSRARRDEDRRLDELSKADPTKYLSVVSRMLADARTGAAGVAAQYRGAVAGAMQDGEMDEEERRAIDALLDAYRDAEQAVDRFADRMREAERGAKAAEAVRDGVRERVSAAGSFYAAEASGMASTVQAKMAGAVEEARNIQQDILNWLRDGNTKLRFA